MFGAASPLFLKSPGIVSQVVPLNKTFFSERVGALSPRLMSAVDEGLKLVMGL